MRPFLTTVLFFTYVLVTGFGVLAFAWFRANDLAGASLFAALTVVAFWLAWECEAALDAQAQNNYEVELMD